MSDFQHIAYHQDGPIAVIIFNRPNVMNALNPQMVAELRQAVKEAADNVEAKALIITGAGRAWSAGVDLKALNTSLISRYFSLF